MVTVLGLAVTAWLIPAMTRQWDDRQKEHDLKAGLVSDISTATAHALVGGEAIWTTAPHARLTREQLAQIGNQWAFSALSIDARLRSYFPGSSVVAGWEVYSWAVDRFINGNHVSMSVELQDAVQNGRLDPGVADALAQLLLEGRDEAGGAEPSFKAVAQSQTVATDTRSLNTLWNGKLGVRARGLLASYVNLNQAAVLQYAYTWTALERTLLDLEQEVANQIIRAHASGFSTTPGDLLHGLVP